MCRKRQLQQHRGKRKVSFPPRLYSGSVSEHKDITPTKNRESNLRLCWTRKAQGDPNKEQGDPSKESGEGAGATQLSHMESTRKLGPSAGGPSGSIPQQGLSVLRVNQLDAIVLDSELHGLLKTQLGRACSSLPAGTLERFRPEVDALFNLLMFRFSVWMQRSTPGMHLQVWVFFCLFFLSPGDQGKAGTYTHSPFLGGCPKVTHVIIGGSYRR